MVFSPYGNRIIDGGTQNKSYLNNGYIVVSNTLCEPSYENIKRMIAENTINHNLREISLPEHCRELYIRAIHEMVSFPYAKYLLSDVFVKKQFNQLKKRKPQVRQDKSNIVVFEYSDADYDLMKITDYFTEEQRIRCSVNSSISPYVLFQSKKFIRKILANQKVISSYIIREQIWKMSKECTLFKNTLVVDICKYYNAKSYLDISAGWGDRLIGALAAGVDRYVAYDPNIKLKHGHCQIQSMFDTRNVSRIYYEPFQSATIPSESFDLVLSSPPFFDFETYSSSASQSDQTFRSLDTWMNGFLLVSISKSWNALKPGGNMIIHIDNVKGYNITSPMIDYMSRLKGASKVSKLYVDGRKGKLRPMFHARKLH